MNNSEKFNDVISKMKRTPHLAEAANDILQAIKDDAAKVLGSEVWVYHPNEEAKIVLLKEGESLPDGWYDCPTKAKEASESAKKPVRSASTKAPEEQAESVTTPQAGG